MCIDTSKQAIDIQQIHNRRFLYNPKTNMLVLGFQYATSSHAVEIATLFMETLEAISLRRSVRAYKPRQVADGVLDMIVKAGFRLRWHQINMICCILPSCRIPKYWDR